MSNKKATKRALLTSVMALAMCVVMLVGTTFAWFTDTAKTSVNQIKAGNLDVMLQVKENGGWTDAKGKTLDFVKAEGHESEAILWEPGCTYELPELRVINNGNLALKYRIEVTGIEQGRTPVQGQPNLNDVIDWTISYGDDDHKVADGEYFLLPTDTDGAELTISGHMKKSAGNEYQGLSINSAAITVYATQYTYESDSISNRYDAAAEYPDPTIPTTATVCTAEELKTVLTAFTDAGSGNNTVSIANDITLQEGETWTPVSVDGYRGAGIITVEGNGHTISGLNNTLFAGGFAGTSGIVIKDLTLDKVTINDTTNSLGLGAFIGSVDSMPKIELVNCHLTNSTITSTGGARVGGLIGWTSGYDVTTDGPVDMHVTITNCSVENCEITAKGSVGGIIGHAGSNAATYQTITGCTVKDTKLTSTDDDGWRVGVVVGTANIGQLTIDTTTGTNNTLAQTGKTAPEHSDLYGRFVPGTTGKLTIDGAVISG